MLAPLFFFFYLLSQPPLPTTTTPKKKKTPEEHRDLVRKILRTILDAGYHPARLYETDLVTYFFLGELLALVDLSTTVKTGVQYSLWGGSVLSLGTARHRDLYYEDIDAFRLPGCFAMTELGHGSNVAGLQTEAVLDVERDEWVITTPVRLID